MGGSSSQQANTSNTSNTTSNVAGPGGTAAGGNIGGNVGIQGATLTQVTKILTNATNTQAQYGYQSLANLVSAGQAIANNGFQFSSTAIGQGYDTLNSVINATRDFSERAIAASTGQNTPIQSLPAAGNQDSVQTSGNSNLLIIIGIAGLAILLLRK